MSTYRYDAVLFDLLTGLLDSWTLWNRVAGSDAGGGRWRTAYLRRTYETGRYRQYETLVAEAAVEVRLPAALASRLAARYHELEPWPEAREVLDTLRSKSLRLGVVTNCSEALGMTAVGCAGIDLDVVVTAERAGYYKPDPRPYEQAIAEPRTTADRCLFVAGSAYDLFGASKVGLTTYWHDRIGMRPPPDMTKPLAHHGSLYPLLDLVPVGKTEVAQRRPN
jgi:2-haloalkanoic acid dehalogenase type II